MTENKKYEEILAELRNELNSSYVDMVDKYANSNSSVEFTNSSLSHASYITCKMLEKATDEVLIISGTLHELYFDSIKIALNKFATKIKKIRIITLHEEDAQKRKEHEDFFSSINKKNKDEGRKEDAIEYLPLQYTGSPENVQHFYVIDKKSWRIEKPHGLEVDHNDIRATICFNDEQKGKTLAETFMSVWIEFCPKEKGAHAL
jgi:hypothetical protein